jgi:hypothetical protein
MERKATVTIVVRSLALLLVGFNVSCRENPPLPATVNEIYVNDRHNWVENCKGRDEGA